VRSAGSPAGLVKPIQEVLGQIDPAAAIETKPMIQALGMALLPSQAGAAMLGSMGMLALVLAATGLYGGLMYAVSRRTREIGIRLALGATPVGVMRVVCRHTAALVGVGMVAGLALAFALGRPVAAFLVPGLSAADPASLLSVVGVLIGVALLATLVPAMRALRVDPMTALRHD
jgi:ABC-type antimicrobial peptide transport system permease subunit